MSSLFRGFTGTDRRDERADERPINVAVRICVGHVAGGPITLGHIILVHAATGLRLLTAATTTDAWTQELRDAAIIAPHETPYFEDVGELTWGADPGLPPGSDPRDGRDPEAPHP